MTADELDLVRAAVAAHRVVLEDLATLVPFWPLGLPGWTDEWVALGLRSPTTSFLTLWHRQPGPATITFPLEGEVADFFPDQADGWTYSRTDGRLTVSTTVPEPSARVISMTVKQ